MPTECSADRFEFAPVEGRAVVAAFDGGAITSDAGALLLGATDRAIGLVRRFAACFTRSPRGRSRSSTGRNPGRPARVRPALGYEDLIDHDHCATTRCWRCSPASSPPAAPTARRWPASRPSTGWSTRRPASRRATTRSATTRRRSSGCSSTCSSTRTRTPPAEIMLDLDATDDPLHGHQEGRFFHGYYDCYCYLPLYVFCGDTCWRPSCGARTSTPAPARSRRSSGIVGQIRARWPQVRILLRADCGFAREALMGWCEANRVDYVFGLARNARLVGEIAAELALAEADGRADRQAGAPLQGLPLPDAGQLEPRRAGWSARPSMDAGDGASANPRFVVTSLAAPRLGRAALYERLYCARGEMENRIKECQLDLFADRTSTSDHARQPAAAVVRLDGLCAARGAAPDRACRHTQFAQRHRRHDPAQAAQDRRPGARLGAPHHGRHGLRPPLAAGLGDRPPGPRRSGTLNTTQTQRIIVSVALPPH